MRHVVLLCYDMPLLLLHLSFVIFIFTTRRKQKILNTGFFTIFVIVAIVDIIHHVLVSFLAS